MSCYWTSWHLIFKLKIIFFSLGFVLILTPLPHCSFKRSIPCLWSCCLTLTIPHPFSSIQSTTLIDIRVPTNFSPKLKACVKLTHSWEFFRIHTMMFWNKILVHIKDLYTHTCTGLFATKGNKTLEFCNTTWYGRSNFMKHLTCGNWRWLNTSEHPKLTGLHWLLGLGEKWVSASVRLPWSLNPWSINLWWSSAAAMPDQWSKHVARTGQLFSSS